MIKRITTTCMCHVCGGTGAIDSLLSMWTPWHFEALICDRCQGSGYITTTHEFWSPDGPEFLPGCCILDVTR